MKFSFQSLFEGKFQFICLQQILFDLFNFFECVSFYRDVRIAEFNSDTFANDLATLL